MILPSKLLLPAALLLEVIRSYPKRNEPFL